MKNFRARFVNTSKGILYCLFIKEKRKVHFVGEVVEEENEDVEL